MHVIHAHKQLLQKQQKNQKKTPWLCLSVKHLRVPHPVRGKVHHKDSDLIAETLMVFYTDASLFTY